MTTMTTTTRPTSSRLMWAILALVLLADALDVIDATVTNIAAPTIAKQLHGGQGLIKWLGTAYMLAMGVLLMVGGRLGDKYGQRRLFLIGMAGFTVASAVAGLSPDPALLIVARVAQGAFGALLIPQGMAIMTKTFSPEMLTKAFGLFGPLLGVANHRRPGTGRLQHQRRPVRPLLAPDLPDQPGPGRDRSGGGRQDPPPRRWRPLHGRRRLGLGPARRRDVRPAVRPDRGLHQRLDHDPDRLDRRRPGLLRRVRPPPARRPPPTRCSNRRCCETEVSPPACSSGSLSSPPRSAWSTCCRCSCRRACTPHRAARRWLCCR
jgi:hypothetical protein